MQSYSYCSSLCYFLAHRPVHSYFLSVILNSNLSHEINLTFPRNSYDLFSYNVVIFQDVRLNYTFFCKRIKRDWIFLSHGLCNLFYRNEPLFCSLLPFTHSQDS